MSTGTTPTLQDVLESFMLVAGEDGALGRYVARYPHFATELADLAHEARRMPPDDPDLEDRRADAAVAAALGATMAAWPQPAGRRQLFAELRPADYGRLSASLRLPRQVIAAIKDGLASIDTIPRGLLRRMAGDLGGTVDELVASIGQRTATASFKSEQRPRDAAPVPFEQILIEARVSDERRAEIMSEAD